MMQRYWEGGGVWSMYDGESGDCEETELGDDEVSKRNG